MAGQERQGHGGEDDIARLRVQLGQLLEWRQEAEICSQRIQQIVLNLSRERDVLRAVVQQLQNQNAQLRRQINLLTASTAPTAPTSDHDYDRYNSGSDGTD